MLSSLMGVVSELSVRVAVHRCPAGRAQMRQKPPERHLVQSWFWFGHTLSLHLEHASVARLEQNVHGWSVLWSPFSPLTVATSIVVEGGRRALVSTLVKCWAAERDPGLCLGVASRLGHVVGVCGGVAVGVASERRFEGS